MILCNEIVMDSVATFWGLRLFLVALMIFCGWGITYKNRDNNYFWYYAIPIIVFYTLIQGLRYGRGADYPHYAQELQYDLYAGTNITREFIYDLFVLFFREFKIPFYYGFIIYSGLLITGFMLVVKKLPKYAFWMIPLFYFITLNASENFIRQFFAISFIFYAYYYYLENNRKMMYIMLLIIPLIHLSGVFAVAVFLICVYVDFTKLLKSAVPLVAFYILFTIVWDAANLDNYVDAFQSVEALEDTNFEGYVEDSERWFTEEGDLGAAVGAERSLLLDLNHFVCNCVILWFGFGVCRRDRRFAIAYYASFVSMLINTLGGNIELIGRMEWWLLPLEPIIIAGMLVPERKYSVKDWALIGLFVATYYLRFLMQVGKPGLFGNAFVWDIM